MEFVCKDISGNWYFDGARTYWCLDSDKKPVGKLYAEYVPDPVKIWQAKCEQAGVTTDSPIGKRLKPTQTVFKLWEHHYGHTNK